MYNVLGPCCIDPTRNTLMQRSVKMKLQLLSIALNFADSTETLEFKIQRLKSESDDQEACMVEANNPQLARRLLQTAIKRGVSQSSVLAIADQTSMFCYLISS